VEKYFGAEQAPYENWAQDRRMLDTEGYRHTLRMCNTYCFSSATVVA